MTREFSNWGNFPRVKADMSSFDSIERLRMLLVEEKLPLIARGAGRCYGDSSLSGKIISTRSFNRILSFNEEDGTLYCEAGITLGEILKAFVPKGWFLPVTPGAKHVTVGGAISADVHGKNHHAKGTFSAFLESFDLMTADGNIETCSPKTNSELFNATCGGMGLTGIIVRASFRLMRIETAWIEQEKIRAFNLDELISLFEDSRNYSYSVAWIDSFATGDRAGRGVLIRGEHAGKGALPQGREPLKAHKEPNLSLPVFLPGFVLSAPLLKAFNSLYYHKHGKREESLAHYDEFFYPLDGIEHWNRGYGRSGFLQYQAVFPLENSREGVLRILKECSNRGRGSFLAVLKLFGERGEGVISFPMKGYTLALDFPVSKGIFEFFNELDKIVVELGGRLYLAKDARMSKEVFSKTYKGREKFVELREKFGMSSKFASLQSERLGI